MGAIYLVGDEIRYSPPAEYRNMQGVPKTMEAAYAVIQDMSKCEQREALARMLFCDLEDCGYSKRCAVAPWLIIFGVLQAVMCPPD